MNFKNWMILKQFFSKVSVSFICLILINCAPASDKASNGTSFKSLVDCENLYKSVFIATYYDIITTTPRTCTNCHSNPGISHEIAIPDPNIAFDNFLLMSPNQAGSGRAEDARQLLKEKIIDPTHHSSGSASYTALVNSYETDWTDVEPAYNSCVNSF